MSKILNYTSEVPVERTIAEIQQELVRAKAQSIRTDYDEQGNISAVYFQINVDGKLLPFKLPAKVDEAYQKLYGGKRIRYWQQDLVEAQKKRWKEQAARTAWRIVYTWLKAQVALIELEQVKLEEIFLPYMVVGKNKTLFQTMQDNQFLLPSG